MSNSVRPHRRQPTRLRHPWDSPGKNTGVGCHFLLQCMKVKSESEVTQSCPTLRDSMDCSPPGCSVHRIFQARVLEWVAIAFSSNLRQPKMSPDMGRSPLGDTPFPSVRTTGLGKAPEKEHKHPTQPSSTSERKKIMDLSFIYSTFP